MMEKSRMMIEEIIAQLNKATHEGEWPPEYTIALILQACNSLAQINLLDQAERQACALEGIATSLAFIESRFEGRTH